MRLKAPFLLLFALQAIPAFSANFSYTGTIKQDDETRQFNFTLTEPAIVTIRTFSYAGGLNAAGTQVPQGGFDPTVSVFDSAGNLFQVNRDGGCASVAQDLVTAFCFDSYIKQQFPAGTWQVVLSQSENLPNGVTLADSFAYAGMGNFTADPEDTSNLGFWDFYPNRRTGSYALDISGVDASQTPIDPTLAGIVNSGSFAQGSAAPNTILSLFDAQLNATPSVTATIGGLSASVLYAGATQINFVVPPGAPIGESVPLEFWNGRDLLLSTTIAVTDAFPALFTMNGLGTGQAAVLNVSEAPFRLNGSVAPSVPAARGSYIAVYGTGFGVANAASSDGLSRLAGAVTATIGGVPAEIAFAGLAPNSTTGLQQINIVIPSDAPTGASVPIVLKIGTHVTQAGTTVAIQ